MADDEDDSQKTEEPTPRKLDDALKKGQVPKSQEVSNWFMISAGTIVVAVFAPGIMSGVRNSLYQFLEKPHAILMDPFSLFETTTSVVGSILWLLLVPVILLITAAIASSLVQHPLVFTTEKMKPKLNKLSLIKGAKQKFSLRQLVDFAKGIVKVSLVAIVAIYLIWPEKSTLPQLIDIDILGVLGQIHKHILVLLGGVVAVMFVIAGVDYAYQQYEHHKSLKMSKQDIKDEQKDSDGDPKIKARLKAIRMERARQRMMTAVPEATVVITNPTHFAVAMKYDAGGLGAPTVVAKGSDDVAFRIREVAEENQVPIVENPPLARALFATVEIDQEIPVEHYKAVAEVIGYVMSLNGPQRVPHKMQA
jgi:flagellar biosynthesis protein FlhB